MIRRLFRRILLLTLIMTASFSYAQDLDSISQSMDTIRTGADSIGEEVRLQRQVDSLINQLELTQQEKELLQEKIHLQVQSITNLEEQARLLVETIEKLEQKERFNTEKEDIYKEAKDREIDYLKNNLNEKIVALNAEKETNAKLNKETEKYRILNDSLRHSLSEAEKKIIRTNEALKYTEQRAKDAEAKVNAATAKKKKVVPIQGIAMKFFRTPDWSFSPDQIEDGTFVYRIVNKNGGKIEFDYTTGASVMLWDLSKKDKKHEIDSLQQKHIEIKKFDQEFSYSLGLYVGFGGKNLFKNFYVGPSFKFLDFFHLTAGVNICEYEMLIGNFQEGDILPAGFSLTDQISKVWKTKPFISLSFDLDFLSYMK